MDELTEQCLLTKHPLHTWTPEEIEETVESMKDQIKAFKTKLVVAYTIYNEEQFLEESLENCLIIRDLDGIHLLDGSWKNGGKSVNSTDNTTKIIKNFHINHPEIKIIYEPSNAIWASEGDKRNHQLQSIEQIWGKQTYAIVKDGDETFEFNTGRVRTWLKFDIDSMYPALGTVGGYAYNGETPMYAVRFIPLGHNYHYHTSKPMLFHDDKCNILVNYNAGNEFILERKCFEYKRLRYVNHWNVRNHERCLEKDAYAEEVFSFEEYDKCRGYKCEVKK
jgi:hypothetical protein